MLNVFDTLIVQTAVYALSESDNVTIVGQDLDIVIVITALTTSDKNIYLCGPGQWKVEIQVFHHNSSKRTSNICTTHSFSCTHSHTCSFIFCL